MKPLVTPQRRKAYERDGFFIIPQLLNAAEVEAIRDEIRRVVQQHPNVPDELIQWEPCVRNGSVEPTEKELGVRKLFRVAKHNAFFRQFASHSRLLEVARALLDDDLRLVQTMLLLKPPNYSTDKVWHQDNAYFRMMPCDVFGFWIACDPATVDNGCMHVVPGSHRNGVVTHEGKGDEYGIVNQPTPNEVVAVPLESGDGLIFHGELFHFTPANRTETRRRAMQYHYAAKRCRRKAGEQPYDLPIEVESLDDIPDLPQRST